MKIVCICGGADADQCVMSGVFSAHEVPLLIVPDYDVKRPAGHWKKSLKKKVVRKLINAVFFKVFKRKTSCARVGEEISKRGGFDLDFVKSSTKVEKVPFFEINSKSVQDLISKHQPDLLLVIGAPILKSRIFSIPKFGAVNFHYGFSPRYKGQHSLLWAFNRGDYEGLGGTFLKIDKGVDTGAPIVFVFPEIHKSDSLEAIEAKLALLARDHISQAMEIAAGPASSERSSLSEVRPRKEFMVQFADYSPIDHIIYHLQRMRVRFFSRGVTLRDEQVDVAGGSVPDQQKTMAGHAPFGSMGGKKRATVASAETER